MKTPYISKETPRWLYEALRAMQRNSTNTQTGLTMVERGEAPFGGGTSLSGVVDHGLLMGLVPDDDHLQYALLRGRVGGQILNGGTTGSSPGTWGSAGDFMSDSQNSSSTSWTTATIDASASVGDIIVLGLVTSAFVNNTTGTSTYHSTITDTSGNTWTKLIEYHYCPDAFLNGECSSLWVCRVTSALTISVSTLTVTLTNAAVKKAISSHRFTGTVGNTVSLTTSTVLTEFGASPLPPTSQTISGLTNAEYLFVRLTGISRASVGTAVTYSTSAGYTNFFSTVPLTQEAQASGSQGVCSFTEYKILTGVSSSTDPGTSETFPYSTSIMVALSLTGGASDGPLTLKAYNSTGPSSITLQDQNLSEYSTNHFIYPVGGSTPVLWIRGSDGTIFGSTSTSDPGTGNWLDLLAFNNPPIAGATSIANRSAQVTLNTNVHAYTDNFIVTERSTDYTGSLVSGFAVQTGLGYVNTVNYGSLSLTGRLAATGPVLTIDHGLAGTSSGQQTVVLKKQSGQTGDMTQWQESTGVVLSYIRASDGAFVGPIVPTGASSMFVSIAKWGTD